MEPDVILLTLVYFFGVTALYGYSIWLPSIIGPTAPPRLPSPLIRPIDAAELSFVSDSWGIFQKGCHG